MTGSGGDQLLPAAVAVSDADRRHAVGLRARNIMAAVADHQRLRGIDPGLLERVGEKIALVDARAVQLRAEYVLEKAGEAEVIDDPSGKDVRLAGRDKHAPG